MTPISFALEIILDCTTIEQAHKKARKFIKLHETHEVRIAGNLRIPTMHPGAVIQAPSTQRLLDAAPPPPVMPPAIHGGEINNGDGTRGKRKW